MIYRATSPNLPYFIDRYRTGDYGERNMVSRMRCNHCNGYIKRGDEYFMLDDAVYCMACRDLAERHILNDVVDSYVYVL